MLRKILIRLFLAGATCVGLVIIALCIAGYLASQEPAFYTALRRQALSTAEQKEFERQLKATSMAFEMWIDCSLARQRTQIQQTNEPAKPLAANHAAHYDPKQDVYTIRITEKQINSLLASKNVDGNKDLRNPRILLIDEQIEIGVELASENVCCVLSAGLKPMITPKGDLQLLIDSVHVGRLPLPLNTILSCLPREIVQSSHDMEVNLTPPTPHVTLNLAGKGQNSPSVKSIKSTSGELVVEFLPPIVAQK